jgi:hypothetical protein
MMVSLLESQTYCPCLQLHLLDGFIEDEPANNYPPLRQMDQTSDHEGGWHDCIASLEERYASGSKFKTRQHIAEDNCRNEWPLIDPVVASSIENITTHDYPFWRIRCRVTNLLAGFFLFAFIPFVSQTQRKRWLIFYTRWQPHGMKCEPPSYTAQQNVGCIWRQP